MLRRIWFVLALLVFPGPVFAATAEQAHTKIDLISEVKSIQPGKPFWIGIRMRMDPHWHVYWRNPGDSGMAPKIDWHLPEGFTSDVLEWPYPQRIEAADLTSFGYENEVLLITEITPPDNIENSRITIKADVNWLACEVPCIPGKASVSLELHVSPKGEVQDPSWQKNFSDTKKKIPVSAYSDIITVKEDITKYEMTVTPAQISADQIQLAEFFPHDDSLLINSHEQHFKFSEDQKSFSLTLPKDKRYAKKITQYLEGVLVIHLKNQDTVSFLIELPADIIPPELPRPLPIQSGKSSLGLMLFFSFVGGMILNLMPCVFPVLSLKVMAIVKQSRNRKMLIRSIFGYVLGVVSAFVLFAIILILMREAGQSAGWGFQFQSPYFVVGMGMFLFVMALNLFGVFEWTFPAFITAGGKNKSVVIESFLTGALATIVATPCTAPFMGTALSFSLTQGPVVNLLIFIFLGLGMAFPFVFLSIFPSYLQKLPKPGPWMENFKRLMGFPLLATVLWFLWILAGQRDSSAVIMFLGGLILITLGLWLREIGKSILIWKMLGWFLVLLGIILPLDHLHVATPAAAPLQIENSDLEWIPYNPTSIQQRLEEGKIVFVDFTARWCLTCQVNKKVALENPEVVRLFTDRGVLRYEADWTSQDPGISAALAEFGKNSVPLYVFMYLPEAGGQKQVKILPELITPAMVKDALSKIQQK